MVLSINHDTLSESEKVRYCRSDGRECRLKAKNEELPVSSFELNQKRDLTPENK